MRKQMIVVSGFALVLALAACGKTNYNATSGNTKSTAKSNPGPTARAATPQAPPPTRPAVTDPTQPGGRRPSTATGAFPRVQGSGGWASSGLISSSSSPAVSG